MSARTRRELRAWGRATGFVALMLVTLAGLVLAGLSTIGGQ
jgi:hypothetical protein